MTSEELLEAESQKGEDEETTSAVCESGVGQRGHTERAGLRAALALCTAAALPMRCRAALLPSRRARCALCGPQGSCVVGWAVLTNLSK